MSNVLEKPLYLITGSAGFIGFHLALRLLNSGHSVLGIDNFSNYYDVNLKKKRNHILSEYSNYQFSSIDLTNEREIKNLIASVQVRAVYHLAAQPGVRFSQKAPLHTVKNNIEATVGLFEALRASEQRPPMWLASSSSVYGLSEELPFAESAAASEPTSIYAASKRSMELMAHSYSHLYNWPVRVLRFFTVYGPWGRPDSALFQFVREISEGKIIRVRGQGQMTRDFTYIDDVIESLMELEEKTNFQKHSLFESFNVGGSQKIDLMTFVNGIESCLQKKAQIVFDDDTTGELLHTMADNSKYTQLCGLAPTTELRDGIQKFVDWYNDYA